MFQKLAPLIVLALFAVGVYFMLQGMQGAMDMADPEKMKAKEEIKSNQLIEPTVEVAIESKSRDDFQYLFYFSLRV